MLDEQDQKYLLNTITTCIYHRNHSGHGGIAKSIDKSININIKAENENFALENDIVEVLIQKINNHHLEGVINKIITHNTTHFTGSIIAHQEKYLLLIDNKHFGNYMITIDNPPSIFKFNELFHTVITNYPNSKQPYFSVMIINKIGNVDEEQTFIKKLIIENNISEEFSDEVMQLANCHKDTITDKELKKRIDLRHLPFITIDGKTARDFDDAVYAEFNKKTSNYTLYVAIADVAHYVTEDSLLDHEAYHRGTSIYLANKVIPMLPEYLSNGLCSLNELVDRLVLCCQVTLDTHGAVVDYKFFDAVIHSQARLTYEIVESWLEDLTLIPQKLTNTINMLHKIFINLLQVREKRGAIDFNPAEIDFIFTDNIVAAINPKIRLTSHRLIEECMLIANVCAADFILQHKHQGLFRIHAKPNITKFNALKTYLNSLGISCDIEYDDLTPYAYNTILKQSVNHEQFYAIEQAVLKSMQLASYSVNNIGHFGLNYPHYNHFTSPIRRYPDLITHRIIKAINHNKIYKPHNDFELIADHSSFAERKAETLERTMHAFYKCQIARQYVGNQYQGIVTNVTNFGLFVFIPNLMLDGLLHIAELPSDYFVFNAGTQILQGKKTGIKYYNGQHLLVTLISVNSIKLLIDLSL